MPTLADAQPGQTAKVIKLNDGNRDYRRRLLSMGLTPGTTFRVVRRAPLGDPVQIEVRNYCLSLRKHEAHLLEIEFEDHE